MRFNFQVLSCAAIIGTVLLGTVHSFAFAVPEASAPACAYCGARLPNGTHASNCPYAASGSPSGGKKTSGGSDINTMVMSTLFETLLTSLFTTDSASQKEAQAAQQRAAELAARQIAEMELAKARAAQAAYEKMMLSYKQLDGHQNAGFKTLASTDLGFKSLDGDAEDLAADSRHPFDTATKVDLPDKVPADTPTPFFGDTMAIEDIQFLVNPDNDPNLVDLREAETYVVENIKNDGAKLEAAGASEPAEENPETDAPACADLTKRLNGYAHQRQQFQKTVLLAREQVDTWKAANRNALLNAAKDGMEYFSGQLLEKFTRRGKAADRLQGIYEKNAGRMAQEGLDVATIEARIERLKMLSTRGQISDLTGNIDDWTAFIKDGMSSLMVQLAESNREIDEMLDDPRLQEYFETDAPELKAMLDISKIAAANKVFGKWVAKKVPVIAGVELAINQSYNALDWFLSYQRIAEANQINGRVLEAAESIQQNIDDTYLALQDCR